MEAEKVQIKKLPFELPESLRAGVYSNVFSVTITNEFVVLDFGSSIPDAGKVVPDKNVVVSRVITSREGAEKLVGLITKLINRVESTDSDKVKK
ncbi:MAG: DUF3467 domain-containing protein [Dehalococcoidia bacterium]|jgi:hypothetical protein